MDVLKDVVSHCINLSKVDIFLSHFLRQLLKTTADVKTACVSIYDDNKILLQIDPTFWVTLESNQKIAILKHECLHIIFKHLFKYKSSYNKMIYNMAADIVVNQFINQKDLPGEPILLVNINTKYNLALKYNATVEYYYENLLESYTSNPSDYDEFLEYENNHDFIELEGLQSDMVETILDETIKTIFSQYPGNKPNYVNQILNIVNAKPIIKWQTVLKRYLQSSSKVKLTTSINKISKRFNVAPGIKKFRKQKILIAIDISGSINDKDLTEFFTEIKSIWNQGHTIEIIEVDTEIHKSWIYKGKNPDKITEGGGTDFNDAITYANTSKPNIFMYFTDGHASKPKVKSYVPLIWCICSSGINTKPFEGRYVFLNNKLN